MSQVQFIWYGPHVNDAVARQRVYSAVRNRCGEEKEHFHIFAMMYDPPQRDDFIFYVANRLFLGTYVDRSLLIIEDNYLNIRQLISVLQTKELNYQEMHFKEEFDHYLITYGN